MSPSTSPSTSSDAADTTTAEETDVSAFGMPVFNIVNIGVSALPPPGHLGPMYKGGATQGLAVPDPQNPKSIGLVGLHALQGYLGVNVEATLTYHVGNPGGPVVIKMARYIGTSNGISRFDPTI